MKKCRYLCALSALAYSLFAVPTGANEPENSLGLVSAAAMGRFTGGYGDDLALLLEPPSGSDAGYTLVILADAAGPGGSLGEIARFEGAAWGGVGDVYGNRPSVAFTDAGSLQLRSGNEAVGRHRWSQTITLVWREDTVMLAGYTIFERDTLRENSEKGCDINLLTGRVEKTNESGTAVTEVSTRQLPFAQWVAEGRPGICPGN